jgi:zinc and cadmium transporter
VTPNSSAGTDVLLSWGLTLASVAAVGLVSLLGLLTLSANEARVRRWAALLMSFAVGALLGDAFIHLLPEIFAAGPATLRPSLLVLAGLLLFFVVEKLLRHHHGTLHVHHHEHGGGHRELATINLIGDGIHNFIDGAVIAASYLASPTLGLATTAAVLLHEIPQEFGDFGVLVHSGLSVRKALLLNLATASTALMGALATLALGAVAGTRLTEALLPLAAGGFVYIAAADLIPELHHDRTFRALVQQASLIGAGIGVMSLLTVLE